MGHIISSLINVLRVAIVPSGVILRVIYCFIKIMYAEDDVKVYKKRIINTILFGLFSKLIFVIKDIIMWYFC